MVQNTEFYDILGVSHTGSEAEIKKAFRAKALLAHPDKGGSAEEFKKISEAYEVLSNAETRKIYDQTGKFGKEVQSGFEQANMNMFWQMFNNMGIHNFNQNQKSLAIIRNLRVTIQQLCMEKFVTIIDVQTSCECTIGSVVCQTCNGQGVVLQIQQIGPGSIMHIQNQCSTCKGSGKIYNGCEKCDKGLKKNTKIFEIIMKSDTPTKQQFIFPNQGNQEPGKQPGDVIVNVLIEAHPEWQLRDGNLCLKRTISLKQSLVGYNEELQHPNGEKVLLNTVGTVVNPYEPYIISGKGVTPNSHILVNFTIKFPVSVDKENIEKLVHIIF